MKFKRLIGALLCIVILAGLFMGCSSYKTENVSTSLTETAAEMFTDRDKETGYDESTSAVITLSDSGIKSASENVKVSANTATISDEGTYILTGEISNGQVIVDAEKSDKVQIVLKNATIGNASSAPIYVKQADKVFITLAENSENTLSVNGEFKAIDDNNIDAVIFAKDDLTLNGNGTLTLNTEYGNGITSKNDLVITSGVYHITAKKHGLEGKDSVRIANGEFNMISGKDGIHSENSDDATLGFIYIADGTFKVTSETDGIDGAVSVLINDGDFNIISGGGSANAPEKQEAERRPGFNDGAQQNNATDTAVSADTTETASAKGIKSGGKITINSGKFSVDTCDDSIHANENVVINGGEFTLATGDDGIHADLNVTINDGKIIITKSYEGIEGQTIAINGGNIDLVASDDGLNASSASENTAASGGPDQGQFAADESAYIKITAGVMKINASGDGVDSNGNLYVTGGEIYVSGPENNGNGALDYNGTADISGGILVAAGASGMAQNFGDTSKQGAILVTTQNMQSGAIILKDSSGKALLNYTPTKTYNSVVISVPGIKTGEKYTVTMGSETQTIEMTSLIYGSGGMGGGRQGFGNGMGGERPQRPEGENMGQQPVKTQSATTE